MTMLAVASSSLFSFEAICQPPLTVVTTTSIIADTTKRIGGESTEVRSLMGEGVDPHLYKASPGDLRLLSAADLVLHNGLHLEGKMADALEKLSTRKPVVAVTARIPTDQLRTTKEGLNSYDPHVWFDVSLWLAVAEHIRDTLIEHDRTNEVGYRTRFQSFERELKELHTWCRAEFQKISPSRRVLITAHDAFGYLGRAYELEVRGIQGLSTDSEASLQDIQHLLDVITQRDIPAVFVENSVSPKAVEALVEGSRSRGHALTIGGELFSDTLGSPHSPAGSYVGMVRHNVVTITSALTRSEPHVTTSD
jgi:manganese/zinc/iron transport system substrate-binding protein